MDSVYHRILYETSRLRISLAASSVVLQKIRKIFQNVVAYELKVLLYNIDFANLLVCWINLSFRFSFSLSRKTPLVRKLAVFRLTNTADLGVGNFSGQQLSLMILF